MDMTIEEVAKACHEMNVSYCRLIGDKVIFWEELSGDHRMMVRDGVSHAMKGATPEDSHANWLKIKISQGWKFGERDDEKKTHPCILPYNELPKKQKAKDKIFLAVVEAMTSDD